MATGIPASGGSGSPLAAMASMRAACASARSFVRLRIDIQPRIEFLDALVVCGGKVTGLGAAGGEIGAENGKSLRLLDVGFGGLCLARQSIFLFGSIVLSLRPADSLSLNHFRTFKKDVIGARHWRGHWGIEIRLHWVRDVSFGEDKCQVKRGMGRRISPPFAMPPSACCVLPAARKLPHPPRFLLLPSPNSSNSSVL